MVALAVCGGLVAPSANAQTPAADEELVLRIGTTVDLTTDNIWAATRGQRLDALDDAVRHDAEVRVRGPESGSELGHRVRAQLGLHGMDLHVARRPEVERRHAAHLARRRLQLPVRDRQQDPAVQSYFPFNPTFETPDDTTLIWKSEEPTFAPDMPPWVYIVPEKVWAEYDGQGPCATIRAVEHVPAIGERSVHAHRLAARARDSPWSATEYFWGEEPDGRSHRVPRVLEPGSR